MGQRNLFYSVMAPFSWLEYLLFSFSLSFHDTDYFISSVLLLPHIWQYSSYPYWTTLVLEGILRYLGFISCSFIPPCPLFILKNAFRTLFAKRIPFVSRHPIRIVCSLRLMKCRWRTDPKYQIVVAVTRIVLTCYFEVCLEVYSNYTKTTSQRRNDIVILVNALYCLDNQNYKFYITNLSPVEYFNSTDVLAIFTSRILLGSLIDTWHLLRQLSIRAVRRVFLLFVVNMLFAL